jgi:hypothetical protein
MDAVDLMRWVLTGVDAIDPHRSPALGIIATFERARARQSGRCAQTVRYLPAVPPTTRDARVLGRSKGRASDDRLVQRRRPDPLIGQLTRTRVDRRPSRFCGGLRDSLVELDRESMWVPRSPDQNWAPSIRTPVQYVNSRASRAEQR